MIIPRTLHLRVATLLSGMILAGYLPLAAAVSISTNSLGIALVEIPAGSFVMGNSEERPERDICFTELPAHPVRISQLFRIGVAEVTLEQFRQFKTDFAGTQDCRPYAAGMTWHDAVAFCDWLSKKEGKPYRLPTEAEWNTPAARRKVQA